ncbi:MAG: dTDP-glucose 4,6-dehydratase [Pseudomonadota bacterium]|jgi:dTDP-glucose 4,6-dehydratase|nr:GDP-mannose 4,6-dehydratase [Alphaproteobacteria bacterium]
MQLFVTGGCGFVGSNFVLDWIQEKQQPLANIDSLNYAGQLANLQEVEDNPLYTFIHGNINNRILVANSLSLHDPDCIVHFAAESKTTSPLQKSEHFLINNVIGTFNLLEETLAFWQGLPEKRKQTFKFIYLSTDEVYEDDWSHYSPKTPYAASKACADHLVNAYQHAFGLPTITIHSGNIYGPRQYSEKMIPSLLHQALAGQQLDVYGNGKNMQDWLYVGDAVAAINLIIGHGTSGESYYIDGGKEQSNLSLIKTMCTILEEKISHDPSIPSFDSLIHLIKEKANQSHSFHSHNEKIESELGWHPDTPLNKGLESTINWYLEHWSAPHAGDTHY